MSHSALDTCLALHGAHASLQLKLDDELGTLHGLAWSDFALLSTLAAAPAERLPLRALVRPAGLSLSGVLRRLAPLEKLGLVARAGAGSAQREIVLQPGGRRLLREATDTAAHVCAGAVEELPEGALSAAGLQALAGCAALRLS